MSAEYCYKCGKVHEQTTAGCPYDPSDYHHILVSTDVSTDVKIEWDERLGSMDFEKTTENYTILVDVPGLTKEEIHADIEEGCMKISGERKAREKKEGVEYLASERSYRRFERTFRLPEDVDLEKVDATVENGVLKMTLGRKVAEKTAKTVKIK